MPLDRKSPHEREGEREAPFLKRRYSTVIGSSNRDAENDGHEKKEQI